MSSAKKYQPKPLHEETEVIAEAGKKRYGLQGVYVMCSAFGDVAVTQYIVVFAPRLQNFLQVHPPDFTLIFERWSVVNRPGYYCVAFLHTKLRYFAFWKVSFIFKFQG